MLSNALRRSAIHVACVTLVATGQAQQAGLSNADVVRMLKAGLSEGVVVAAIQAAPTAAFELTPDALIKLKVDGVGNVVLAAMLAKGAEHPIPAAETVPSPNLASAATALEITVPDNTEILVRLTSPVTSKSARVNDRVNLVVARDIVLNGKLIFAKGSPARGTVTQATPPRALGRSGKLAFSIESVQAVNGQAVRVSSAARSLEGEDRVGATVAAMVLLGPLGSLNRGKNVEVPAGTEYVTYTVGDRRLDLAGVPAEVLSPKIVPTRQPSQAEIAPAPAPIFRGAPDLIGVWKVTLPNTTVTVSQRNDGKFLLEMQGQYGFQGEITLDGLQASGTVSNACMSGRPITMLYEARGWTGRTEFLDCAKGRGAPGRVVFRLSR